MTLQRDGFLTKLKSQRNILRPVINGIVEVLL
jgi:hypothetical protein